MRINSIYKIDRICSRAYKDLPETYSDPHLFADKKRVMATDGTIIASIPAENISKEDVSGPINKAAIESANDLESEIELTAESATVDKITHKEVYARRSGVKFPNTEEIISKPVGLRVAIDTRLLARLALAIGSHAVILTIPSDLAPVYVEPLSKLNEAFGAIMPIRIDDDDDEEKQ